jgi:putative flippase GtrA
MRQFLRKSIDSSKVRYLIAGGWNTLFGYLSGVLLYYLLRDHFHVVEIAILGNVIAITMAFVTYKMFVFQTKGNWLAEYLRTYLVYGGIAIVGIGLLWILVDGLVLPFWIAQGLVIAVTVVISYLSHSRFTFRQHAP